MILAAKPKVISLFLTEQINEIIFFDAILAFACSSTRVYIDYPGKLAYVLPRES